jgi:hypothetical protein
LSLLSSLIFFVSLLLPRWVIAPSHRHIGLSIPPRPAGLFSFGLLDELDVRLVCFELEHLATAFMTNLDYRI